VTRLHAALARRRNRWLLLGAAVVLVTLGAVAAELLRIRDDLYAGRDALTGIDLSTVDDRGGLAAVADRAADRIDAAASRARTSPVLRALSVVPFVGRQVDAVRDMTAAVEAISDQGREAAAGIEAAIGEASGPSDRLEVVRAVDAELVRLAERLDEVGIRRRSWLLPPLHDAQDDLSIELADARSDIDRSRRLTETLHAFLSGPRRYLVLGGNNAEMRAVAIPTTSGIAAVAGGTIEVGEFSGATDTIELPEPGVPVPLEYENVYGWLNGDRGYRTTLATANWPVAARIVGDITAANQYGPVDGVIYVDTVTLATLLAVIGPVEVDGVEYRADNVLQELLYENYLEYRTLEESPERRELQSRVAQAIFDALNERDFDILELAGALSDMARGRHLLAWSADESENDLWESFEADGRLRSDGIGVVSQELGASKLDYFTYLDVEVDAEQVEDDVRQVTMAVTITNPDHPETSPYIDGGGMYADPGEYGAFLVAYLPAGAFDIRSSAGFTHHGPDGPMYAAGSILRVPEGETRTVEIIFSLSAGREVLTVMPAARIFGTKWTWGDQERRDFLPFEIDLSEID
jgi:hypothetical protein